MNYPRFIVLKILFLIPIAIVLVGSPSVYGSVGFEVGPENRDIEMNYVNISSPVPNQNVTIGNLTVAGASSDNLSSNCTVFVGWNHSRPFQKAIPDGIRDVEDYSKWNFTFDPTNHEIVNGTNLINSELSCFEFFPHNVTSYSLNITGVINTNSSNFTDTGYFYPDNSTAGLYDTSSLGSDTGSLAYDNLAYDNSTVDYSSDGYSTDSGNYYYDSGSTDGSYNNGDSSGDDASPEATDCGNAGTTYPLVDNGVFNIGAAGDWASGSNACETALNMHRKGVDLTLGLGDYAYSTGSAAVHDWWNNQMAPLHDRFVGALGNHDTKDQSVYAELFGQESERWFYSFDKQGVHFVAINSEEAFGPGSSQFKFIDQDLQSASSRSDVNWIIVYFHQPMYTSPSHHDPVSSLRDAYHPLFDKYDVDLVLQGHNHNYQRSFPIAYNSKDPSQPIVTSKENLVYNDPPGQIYAEVGTGGKESYSLDGRSSFISRQLTTAGGFLDVAFPNGQTMKGTFYDNSGSVEDEFTIKKSASIPSNATINAFVHTNATNATNTNATNTNATNTNATNTNATNTNATNTNATERILALSANVPIVNTNTSGEVIPLASPLDDNQTSLLNGDGISSSQDSPNINNSLQAGREITSDDIRNKVTKLASEMAKEVLDKAEQTLNDNKIVATNTSRAPPTTIVTTFKKSSEQAVNQEKQGTSDTIQPYDEFGTHTNYQLAQQAENEIDRAWESLDSKFGSIVTKTEQVDNPKSDSGVDSSDTLQSSNIDSAHIASSKSNSETDGMATENQLHVSKSQTGKSDTRSTLSNKIPDSSHLDRKVAPKADAGQNQEVIEGTKVTLDGTKTKIGEANGLRYSWEQVSGPKVKIIDDKMAIASFEAPKISSDRDKLTLKFVLLITSSDNDGRNSINNKDSMIVIVKQDPLSGRNAELPSSIDIKDRSSSQDKDKVHSSDTKDSEISDSSKHNDNGKPEETKNAESAPHADTASPIESTRIDANNSDMNGS